MPLLILQQFEAEVVQEFRTRFQLSDWSDLEVMGYARHHGAPTRLLDWSQNPFVGLWFAVSDKKHDSNDGVVFQLRLGGDCNLISFVNGPPKVQAGADCSSCKCPVHAFPSSPRVDRTERQRSLFSLPSFTGGYALQPLDEILKAEKPPKIRKFPVPRHLKPELRRLLSDVGLDAYSVYGDPDSFGKALAGHLDLSGLNISTDIPDELHSNPAAAEQATEDHPPQASPSVSS